MRSRRSARRRRTSAATTPPSPCRRRGTHDRQTTSRATHPHPRAIPLHSPETTDGPPPRRTLVAPQRARVARLRHAKRRRRFAGTAVGAEAASASAATAPPCQSSGAACASPDSASTAPPRQRARVERDTPRDRERGRSLWGWLEAAALGWRDERQREDARRTCERRRHGGGGPAVVVARASSPLERPQPLRSSELESNVRWTVALVRPVHRLAELAPRSIRRIARRSRRRRTSHRRRHGRRWAMHGATARCGWRWCWRTSTLSRCRSRAKRAPFFVRPPTAVRPSSWSRPLSPSLNPRASDASGVGDERGSAPIPPGDTRAPGVGRGRRTNRRSSRHSSSGCHSLGAIGASPPSPRAQWR